MSLSLSLLPDMGAWMRPTFTPTITGKPGIASLEEIELGGMEQWILIRGQDVSNPVLLWLHGEPGAAQMPVARCVNGELEEHFIIVHWDQRSVGKSNSADFEASAHTPFMPKQTGSTRKCCR